MDVVTLYATWPNLEQAEAAGRALIERKLAACVNLAPGIVSLYPWKGEIARDSEVLMLVKTTARSAEAARDALLEAHPYELPCITAFCVDFAGANGEFLKWVNDQTR